MSEFRTTGPQVHECDVVALESRLNAPLPPSYRNFVIETNGGVPEGRYVAEPSDIGLEVKGFFSLDGSGTELEDLSLTRALSTWAGRYPQGFLPIALCEGSNLLLLSLQGENTGAIVYWDHDAEAEDDEPARTDNLTPVANSFTSLLAHLTNENPDEAQVQRLVQDSTGWVDPDFKPKFT